MGRAPEPFSIIVPIVNSLDHPMAARGRKVKSFRRYRTKSGSAKKEGGKHPSAMELFSRRSLPGLRRDFAHSDLGYPDQVIGPLIRE